MKLSPEMMRAIETARLHGHLLLRWPGGFWTYPGCAERTPGIPVWSVSTHTLKALAARGRFNVNWRQGFGVLQ